MGALHLPFWVGVEVEHGDWARCSAEAGLSKFDNASLQLSFPLQADQPPQWPASLVLHRSRRVCSPGLLQAFARCPRRRKEMRSGHQASGNAHSDHGSTKMSRPYGMLALNLAISLAIMYFVMFAMINSLGEFIQNLNFLYMALMMWAPMGTLMLVMMGGMYRNKRLNLVLHGLFALIFVLSFIGIREQSLVGDRQFVRSMIPHHSGAILMCREAQISDPEIKDLCETDIIPSQRKEVEQMKAILARL
jgi:hypothetical protein